MMPDAPRILRLQLLLRGASFELHIAGKRSRTLADDLVELPHGPQLLGFAQSLLAILPANARLRVRTLLAPALGRARALGRGFFHRLRLPGRLCVLLAIRPLAVRLRSLPVLGRLRIAGIAAVVLIRGLLSALLAIAAVVRLRAHLLHQSGERIAHAIGEARGRRFISIGRPIRLLCRSVLVARLRGRRRSIAVTCPGIAFGIGPARSSALFIARSLARLLRSNRFAALVRGRFMVARQ